MLGLCRKAVKKINVLELFATLTLDSSEYEKGLSDSKSKAEGFGGKLGSVMKAGGVAIAAVTTATAALTTGIAAATGKTAEYGDNIDKMSQKMGMSAEAYQEWDAIMQHSGTSMETMKAGMKTLANAVENGNEAFQRIGLTQEQIASMSQEDLFAATIAGLQNVDSETERTYLAGQLLGRGATELGALLNTSAEDTEKMRQRVHELGGVMSDDAVKASARYQDSLQDMQTAFGGLSRNMMAEFLPSIATVMDGLGNLFSGNGGLDQIREGISEFAGKISEELPKFVEVGSQILIALVDAIVENLPTLLGTAAELIVTLAVGLINELPKLLEKAPEIIAALVGAIITAAPQLLQAAGQLILTLAQGIANGFSQLIAKGREIVQQVKAGVLGAVSSLADAGMNLVRGIWNGISNGLGWIKSMITGWVGNVVSFIKNLFGIHSPSSVMRDEVGVFLAKGIGVGFEKEMGNVEKLMRDSMPNLSANADFTARYNYSTSTANGGLAAEIAALRADVRNMRIYLDTGVIAGAVDSSLGGIMASKGRRALA